MGLDLMNALLAVYQGELKRNEPMARHTSFRVGGPCDLFVKPKSLDDLRIAVSFLTSQSIPLTFVGDGTNLLVRDGGIEGAVICLADLTEPLTESRQGEAIILEVPAGVKTQHLCRMAAEKGYAGLTFATGIPGTLGGALTMNASTEKTGWETVVQKITVVKRSGKKETLKAEAFDFHYRRLSIGGKDRLHLDFPGIAAATLVLTPGNPAQLEADRQEKLSRRKASQPVSLPSAGCFFKNPETGPSAGQLIDELGMKGRQIGGAQISERHANYIVNTGSATAQEILDLAHQVRENVFKKKGTRLEEEVTLVGRQA